MQAGWEVVRRQESAATFHARPFPEPLDRSAWVCDPTGPALVLGSAQRASLIDEAACAERGIEVVRRRSGGGAVLVAPGDVLWVDVFLPAGDPLWHHDVGRAFVWLGEVWQAALAELGVATQVHDGALRRSALSDAVCFAGLGPGELTNADGAKVVGISQRRTRAGARFQCAALGRWDPMALVPLLGVDAAERERAASELTGAAAGVGVPLEALLVAFIANLP